MNWEKAKTLTIIFLLLINVFLAALVYNAGRRYTMSAAQELAIQQYMSRNGVSLYTTIPSSFRPMQVLRMQPSVYSVTDLTIVFFGSTDHVLPIPHFLGGQAFGRGTKRLEIKGSRFTYENAAPNDEFVLTRENAIEICEKFVSKHEKVLGRHVLDRHMIREIRDGFSITFNGKFRDWLVTSNTLIFHVTEGGIAKVFGEYNAPMALSGDAREIIRPEEALYLFVKHMNYILYDDQKVIVTGMDIVYHLIDPVTTDSSIPLNATPCYRFWVRLHSGEAQVMINAYTGGVLGGFF